MKKHLFLLSFILVFLTLPFSVYAAAPSPKSITVQEADGSPKGFCRVIKFPNGSLTITGGTGIVTYSGGGAETDPIVGAISGLVEADGAGNISAATEGTDYLAPARIDDTKGNGDTGYVWSVDKSFDQFALKEPLLTADSIDTLTDIASTLKSGSDATLITGTKGTSTHVAVWNADGDLIGGAGVPYTVGGTDVPDADVADDITITNISQVADITATAVEINYTTDVTGLIQAALDARCLESVLGESIAASLLLTGTVLSASAILQEYHAVDPAPYGLSISATANEAAFKSLVNLEAGTDFISPAANANISGLFEFQDDIGLMHGNDADWWAGYDTSQSHYALKAVVDSTTDINEDPFAAGDTTLTVDNGAVFYTNCFIKIESEYLKVTAIATHNLTVTRGQLGSTDAAHADNTDVYIHKPYLWLSSTGVGSAAQTTPSIAGYDKDAETTETTFTNIRLDQYSGSIEWPMTTTTEDAWVSDIELYSMIGASGKKLFGHWDASDESWTWGDSATGEDLKWDYETATDNEIAVTSPAGATDINFGALKISGSVKGVVDANPADGEIDAYCYGGIFFASGTGTAVLPAVAEGMQVTVENHTAADVWLDPDASEVIRLNGTALTGGFRIIGTDLGDGCVCTYYSAGVWSCFCSGYADAGS